jgi:hypothetical protein
MRALAVAIKAPRRATPTGPPVLDRPTLLLSDGNSKVAECRRLADASEEEQSFCRLR